MATLYKRANPLQKQLLRMVEGAVKNVLDAHKDIYPPMGPDKFARSIAKRAVGTMTSQWGTLLALGSTRVIQEAETASLSPSGDAETDRASLL